MKVKSYRPWLAAPVALVLATLACSLGGSNPPTSTPEPPPTKTSAPKPTVTKSAPKPTQAPAPTTSGGLTIPLADTPYAHPSGAFTQILPVDWTTDERDDGVFINSPDGVASMDVSFVNVGVELTTDEFDTFVEAVEDNWFSSSFTDYERITDETEAEFRRIVGKTLKLEDGTEQAVISLYLMRGTVVFEQDLWVDSDQFDAYADALGDSTVSLTVDETAGALAPVYNSTYKFLGPRNLFEMRVPYAWTYQTDSSDNAIVDTFTSPDGLSQIENVAYDDGTPVSKSQAGAVALALLKEYYEVDDIKVTGDKVQPDGSERLTWTSDSKGWDGESFFETRGTTFLLLTWIVDSDFYDLYEPVWTATVSTYIVPE